MNFYYKYCETKSITSSKYMSTMLWWLREVTIMKYAKWGIQIHSMIIKEITWQTVLSVMASFRMIAKRHLRIILGVWLKYRDRYWATAGRNCENILYTKQPHYPNIILNPETEIVDDLRSKSVHLELIFWELSVSFIFGF